MDFDFFLEKKVETARRAMEYWVPLGEEPMLRKNEIQSLWYGKDVVDSLHLVKIAYLYKDDQGAISYLPGEVGGFFLAGRLKKIPYMVIYDYYETALPIDGEIVNPEKPYYIDFFYSPNFGTFRPKYFLFQQTNLKEIPDTMVLFREI